MNTKFIRSAFATLVFAAAGVAFTACEEDHGKVNTTLDPSEKIEAPAVSVAEGEEVDAATTKLITLTYAKPVALNPDVPITINDVDAKATVKADDRRIVELRPELAAGKSYKVEVNERAVAIINSTWFAPAVTLNFTTKADAPVETKFEPLTNASATAETKAVYTFLCEQHGKKILSGASAGDGNNDKFADWISGKAGKHAAVAGYDFLHHKRSGENWIDYTDISAATGQWNAGGLVSYMWHWNVPTDEQAYNDKNWDKYGFYCDATNFDIKNALTDGTWENKVILEDIDQIAGYLKLLQDAGVPVLWRPLHEAAGSFKYNNPWFWWGRGGVEATRQLWILMHDRLVGHHGLNNLIWVWTAQWDEGFEAQMADAYPGNEYVDAVGVDSYREDGESEEAYTARVLKSYDAVLRMTDGKKMVALSECGFMTDMGSNLDKAPWAWFMVWASDIDSDPATDGFGNSTDWIRTVFGNDNILNREDMPSLK